MTTISRKDVREIYKIVCSGWQTKIDKILEDQKFSENIEVEDSLIREGLAQADAGQKKVISKYFSLPKSITERINNIEDVLKIVGKSYDEVVRYKNPINKSQRAENARNLIECITEAYNEGVKFDWTNSSQYKYYPYFEKKAHGWWVLRHVAYGCTFAYVGFGFYFATEQLARDAVSKFMDIYIDYLPE